MTQNTLYSETTRAITILVESIYLEEQSVPDENHYVWAYHVRIENHGEETVQLLTRHWRIMDQGGNVQEVKGDGVVGEQPSWSRVMHLNTQAAPLSAHHPV